MKVEPVPGGARGPDGFAGADPAVHAAGQGLEEAAALSAAAVAIHAETDDVAARALAEVRRWLRADDGSVLLSTTDGRLMVAAGRDAGTVVRPEPPVLARVLERGEPALQGGDAHGGAFPGMDPLPLSGAISVPLRVGETLVGVLNLGRSADANGFAPVDLRRAVLLAGHAAVALANHKRMADQRRSLAALREADRRRSDILAMITHDLKTPLTALIGYVHLLQKRGERAGPVERAEFYGHMDRQSRRMLDMVEDLLQASRLEQGVQNLKREPLDLVGILEETRTLFLGRAPERHLVIQAAPVQDVYGDRNAIAHVLQNLVDNALKYSPPGSTVWIAAEDRPGEVLLSVRDEGKGVPPEERDAIFDRFRRAQDSGPRGSVGLGLHIVRGLVSAHGGRVWCDDSEAGAGATFYFTLPRRSSSPSPGSGS